MGKCIVLGCSNTNKSPSNIHMHRFPLKKPELLDLWVKAVGRKNWEPRGHHRLCSNHFTQNDYEFKGNLKPDAVPSIFSTEQVQHIQKVRPILESVPCDQCNVHGIHNTSILVVTSECKATDIGSDEIPESTMGLSLMPSNEMVSIPPSFYDQSCSSSLQPDSSPEYQSVVACDGFVSEGTQTAPPRRGGSDSPQIIQLKKQIKTLQRTVRRRDKKLKALTDLVGHLTKTNVSSDNLLEVLQAHFSSSNARKKAAG